MEEEEVALIQLRTNLSFANSRCTEPFSCTLGYSMLFLTMHLQYIFKLGFPTQVVGAIRRDSEQGLDIEGGGQGMR